MSSYFWGKTPSSEKCKTDKQEDDPKQEAETSVKTEELSSCVKDNYVKPDTELQKEVEGEIDTAEQESAGNVTEKSDAEAKTSEKTNEKDEESEESEESDEESEESEESDEESESDEGEQEEESKPNVIEREYTIDRTKPLWIITADGRPVFYTDTEKQAEKILWSAAKRCCRQVSRYDYSSVHLTPRAKNRIDITGYMNFVIMQYDQTIHSLSYRRAPFASINTEN